MRSPVLFLALALAAIVGAFFVPTDPVSGGGRTLEAWLVLAFGLSVVPLAAMRIFGPRPALLGSLFLAASAGWLTLTTPLWLNEFMIRPHHFTLPGMVVALSVILVQFLVVTVLMVRSRSLLRALTMHVLNRRALVVSAVLICSAAAHVTLLVPRWPATNHLVHFAAQIAVALFMAALGIAHLALLWQSLPADASSKWGEAVSERLSLPWTESAGRWDARLPWVLSVAVFAVTAAIAFFVFERMPHIPDGFAYLFQARAIADGTFAFPQLPAHESFQLYLVDHRNDLSYSITNPGWPMILAPGVKLGAAWLVNPLLAALCIPVTHRLIASLAGRGWANLVTVLLAASPWFLFLGASFMTHVATMLFATSGALLAWRARERARADSAFSSGLCFGVVFLIRPLDGLMLGSFAGLFLLVTMWRAGSARWRLPLGFSAGAVVVAGVLLVFNSSITGDPFTTPINDYILEQWPGSTNRLGFGPEVGNPPNAWGNLDPFPGHGLADVLVNTNQNLVNLNVELFGWTTGSLLGLALFFLLVRQRTALDRTAFWSLIVLGAGYNLYWFSGGPDFGPRYWFSMLLPLVWLSARGLSALIKICATHDEAAHGRGLLVLLLLVLGSSTLLVGRRIESRYREYRGYHTDVRQMKDAGEFGAAVVFIAAPDGSDYDYSSAFLLNDFPIDGAGPVFVRDLGMPANAAVMAAFPGKPAVFVDGRAITGARARIRLR